MASELINKVLGIKESMFMRSPRLTGAKAQRAPLRTAVKTPKAAPGHDREREEAPPTKLPVN